MNYQENKNHHHMPLVYIVLAFVFVATTVYAILTISGYRWNLTERTVEQYGVLQVKTYPVGASIKINDRELGFLDGSRLDLSDGQHEVTVRADGYQTWQDKITIKGSRVKWLNVRLFPDVIEQTIVKNYPALLNSHEAPNHRFILNHLAKNHFELVDLTAKQPKYVDIMLSDYFAQAGDFNFEFLEWNLASDSLVFQDKNSAKRQTIMINYRNKDTRAVVDLTTRYANNALTFQNFVLTGGKGMVMHLLEGDKLYRLDLAATDAQAELIADGVKRFAAIDENKIAYAQTDPNDQQHPSKVILFNYKTAQPILFDKVLNGFEPQLNLIRLNNNDYFIYSVDQQLMVFKADGEFYNMKSATLDNTLDRTKTTLLYERFLSNNPKIKLVYNKYFTQPIDLRKGINPRFVTVLVKSELTGVATDESQTTKVDYQENANLFVYDIENEEAFEYTYHDEKTQSELVLKWLDNVILWTKTESGIRVRYFDGENSRVLTGVKPLHGVQFSGSETELYYFSKDSEGKIDLVKLKM